jgi:adenosine deaminase
MKDAYSLQFKEALRMGDLERIRKVPKSDLHNHFTLGGNRAYIQQKTGRDILPLTAPLTSMDQMHQWVSDNFNKDSKSTEMRRLKIEATFVQAHYDGIKLLEIGEDVWALNEYFNKDIHELISAFRDANRKFSPLTQLRLQIGLSRHCSISYLESAIEPFWDQDAFYALDLYGDESAQPIENFHGIYAKAKKKGLKVKAHVGEWGSAKDVIKAIQVLELDEVQHGIAIATDAYAMDFVKERGVRLNITPTSNVLLGRTRTLSEHPIRLLFEKGLNLTIGSDDVLIFDSDVSKEYLRLYSHGVLGVDELDQIRLNGLRPLE